MNRCFPAALLSAILMVVSCAPLTPGQQNVVDTARTIEKYPVKRTELVRKFQLDGLPQRATEDRSEAGYFCTETWDLPSRLVLRALHAEPRPPGGFTLGPFEPLLKSPDRPGVKPVRSPRLLRMSCQRLEVVNGRGKVVFDSASPEEVARRGGQATKLSKPEHGNSASHP